jgi:lipopolysaccharide export system protein LptA
VRAAKFKGRAGLVSLLQNRLTSLTAGLLLGLVCALWASSATAEKADRDKPMNITADVLRYDDVERTSVFTGRVLLTQGSLLIRGDKLVVRQDPQGYQYGTVTAAPGKLAAYRQKREGLDEYMEGEAEVIEYDGRADTVKLTRRAQMRRYNGSALSDEMAGGVIFYNNLTQVFTLDGAARPGAQAKPTAARERVRVTLIPKPPAATAPNQAPIPGLELQASPQLDGVP